MWRVALTGLAALASVGCNQVFGLDETVAAVPPDDPQRVLLRLQLATTDLTGKSVPLPRYAVIDPAPRVQGGGLSEPLTDLRYRAEATPGPTPSAAPIPPGSVGIPSPIGTSPWRLVYQLEGRPPREVQWRPERSDVPALVEPVVGRATVDEVPPGSGYAVRTMLPVFHQRWSLFTIGAWSEHHYTAMRAQDAEHTITANTLPLGRVLSAPRSDLGDRAVFIEYLNAGACDTAVGIGSFAPPELRANVRVAPVPAPSYTKDLGAAGVRIELPLGDTAPAIRIRTALGSRWSSEATRYLWRYGYVPGTARFALAEAGRPPGATREPALFRIAMLPLATCASLEGAYAPESGRFTRIQDVDMRLALGIYLEAYDVRLVSGVELLSGYATFLTSGSQSFNGDLSVAAPTAMALRTGAGQRVELTGPTDGVEVRAEPGLMLDIDLEGVAYRSDYVEVTIHAILDAVLKPQVVIASASPTGIAIDPAYLVPGAEHVVEVRSYLGRPRAAAHDFSATVLPQSAARFFSRTFRVP